MKLNWEKKGIDPSKVVGNKAFCPECHHTRKHKRDRSLSVDLKTGVFNCHNCGWKGSAVEIERKKDYVKPVPRLEKLSKKVIEFFEQRGISNNTLIRFQVSESTEWMPQFEGKEVETICFNYFRKSELVNIKFRGPKKSFRMEKNAELIFYNLDAIEDEREVVIVEGEIDCLTMHECGIFNSISVPNGASPGSAKLEYLDNCWRYFEDKTKIILAVDGDEAGNGLRNELCRRLGREKCFTVEYPEDCKDANDVLQKYGPAAVKKLLSEAKEWPLEGIIKMDDIYPTIQNWYENGYPKGKKARIPGLDELIRFVSGKLLTITGIPTHGKDEFSNWIIANLAKYESWPAGLCDFEETPAEVTSKLAEKLTGKAFDVRDNPEHRMTPTQLEEAIRLIDQMVYFVNIEETESDIDLVLEIGAQLVRQRGIKIFRINPWNWLEFHRPGNMTETEYASLVLSKIIRFAMRYDVLVILIAHTTKLYKNKKGDYDIPTLYHIAGSAHFYNKTHYGMTVFRNNQDEVDVVVQKVKQSWLGKKGSCSFGYDWFTRQYVLKNGRLPDPPSPLNGNFRKLKHSELFDEKENDN